MKALTRRWAGLRTFEGRVVLACTVLAIIPIVTAAVRAEVLDDPLLLVVQGDDP